MIEVLLILIALLLVLACGAFVAAEFAFVTVDRASVQRAADAGDARAHGVLAGLRTLSTQLSAAQLGITVTNLLIGFLAEPAIAGALEGPLGSLGLSDRASDGVAVVVALVLATTFTMVFGELVPKNLAIAQPLATARAVQGFQRGFTRATAVLVRSFNAIANAILRRLGVEPQEELASARSAEELASLVGHSARQGTLDQDTATLLQRSLAFGERHAADVMTPRARMRTVRAEDPVAAVLQEARASGRSRFPVTAEGSDAIAGIVHLKHAIAVERAERPNVPVADIMVAPVAVPSTVELDPLLATLRDGGLQMAIVVDEWGNVDGLVTLEDLIEEIVGDVRDEHDERDDAVRRDGDGRWTLSGLLRPDEVARATGVVLPEGEDYETLAGLLSVRLERVPRAGDRVTLETADLEGAERSVTLTVERLEGLRVDRVRLEVAR